MFDILSELRTYAAANDMRRLVETLDDALMLLAAEARAPARAIAGNAGGRDKR
jgi:hypothetical protein